MTSFLPVTGSNMGASSDTALKALVSSLKSKASAKAKAKPAAAAQRPPKRPLSS